MKRRLLLQSVALPMLFVGPAMGADLPAKAPPSLAPATPAYNWTGFYVGLNAGGAWGHSDVTTNPSCTTIAPFFNYFCTGSQANANAIAAAGTGSMSGSGFTGGGQIGYNFRIDRAVLGIESDINSFNIKASRQVGAIYPVGGGAFPPGINFTINSSVDTNWLFTARGRAGWLLFDSLLAYATGGLAVTDLHVAQAFRDSTIPVSGAGNWSGSKTKLGWTVGGGFEWALTRNWSVKAEYLYLNFGSVNAAGLVVEPVGAPPPGYGNAISTSADLSAHIARAGVNYRF